MTKSRGILFGPEMVRKILDGRKTQTRRVITLQPPGRPSLIGDTWEYSKFGAHVHSDCRYWEKPCPYGVPGDLLYCKENWRFIGTDMNRLGRTHSTQDVVIEYQSDDASRTIEIDWREAEKWMARKRGGKPSIHMPKWASRLWLRITDVRVERLQDICLKDIEAEGIKDDRATWNAPIQQAKFSELWDSINEKRGYGWDANPWCWILTYERTEARDA